VGGKWYVLVVVEDYSRYAWVFFLEDKSETFGFVRDLIVTLKNERHGNAIRAIRGDNGLEFKNSHFDAFCRDLGLEHQYSTPFVPPKNGVVERKNRTLCEMARMSKTKSCTIEPVHGGGRPGRARGVWCFAHKTSGGWLKDRYGEPERGGVNGSR
jgi:transposase InsO family protein